MRCVNELRLAEFPFVIAGRMSNVLFRKPLYDGVVIKTTNYRTKNEAENTVTLSCGSTLRETIRDMASKDLGGMEGLFGIPGSVGGMVKQNAGAFGYEIADRFVSADCYFVSRNQISTVTKKDMEFEYRNSALSSKETILLSATFSFVHKRRSEIFEEIADYTSQRRQKQPIAMPSLGSVFKRCEGIGAGYYIDKAKLRGHRVGGAEISGKHAGFIVNAGGATADDYLALIELAKERVYNLFGIELQEEIEII